VGAPDPGRVGGAYLGEDVMDVAPGGDERARLVPVDTLAPGEPEAVHLLIEAEEERVAPSARPLGEFADVGVEVPPGHVGQLEVRLVQARGDRLGGPGEHRDRSVPAQAFHRTDWEREI